MKFKDVKEVSQEGFNNALLVDALNLSFRYMRGNNNKSFHDKYIETIRSLARSYECSDIIVCYDIGSSSYRKGLLPEYKDNRKEKYKDQTEEEKEDIRAFFEEYNKSIETLKTIYPTIGFQGVEADDIIAYICSKQEEFNLGDIWIISSDRDLDQLITDKISRFSFITRKEITADNWSTHYDHTIAEHIDIKCLEGDKGDNVMGVPGVGPKKAHQLVQTYGGVYDIHGQLPIDSKYKYIQNLNEFGDKLLLNMQLMDLPTFCEEAVGEDNIKIIQETLS